MFNLVLSFIKNNKMLSIGGIHLVLEYRPLVAEGQEFFSFCHWCAVVSVVSAVASIREDQLQQTRL